MIDDIEPMQTLEKFFNRARKIKLTKKERLTLKTEIIQFVQENPIPEVEVVRKEKPNRPIFQRPMIFAMLTSLIILFSGGTALAAEQSLPGEPLYPVKIMVNERVRLALSAGSETKARRVQEIALRRLEEAETLAADGRLSAEVATELAARFDESSKNFLEQAPAVLLVADFDAALAAHQRILITLKNKEDSVGILIAKVAIHKREVEERNIKAQAEVASRAETDSRAAAEGKMKSAENKILEVKKFIANVEARLGAGAVASAKARLADAEEIMVEGKSRLEAGSHNEAFLLFQKAHAVAQEAKFLAEAVGRLKLEIKIEGKLQDENGEDEEKSETKVDTRNKGAGEVKSEKDEVKTEVESKTNVGAELKLKLPNLLELPFP